MSMNTWNFVDNSYIMFAHLQDEQPAKESKRVGNSNENLYDHDERQRFSCK